jgi:hypothetical protein
MINVRWFYSFLFFSFFIFSSYSQNANSGEIHGNFETTAGRYYPDVAIGADTVDEKVLMNGYANINYSYGNFLTAGIRYESYLNALQGYPVGYKGNGIPYRYVSYKQDELEVTVGNYYEQFGNGLIFRSYEERALGLDNVMDGIRLRYRPYRGIYLKGLVGKQRLYFSQGPGIIRGADGEIQMNELFAKWNETKTRISIGGSFVSKYQIDQDPTYNLPKNVGAAAGRLNLIRGDFSFGGEYAYKINDPSTANGFIYKPGDALFLTTTYSKKGFALSASAKHIDNMSFRSDRTATVNDLLINYLPALTKQHTYALAAFYPYASQANGEVAFQTELLYKLKKDSKLGGPYGTDVLINYSGANALDKTELNDSLTRQGYKTNYFGIGKEIYFRDFVIEINRKFSKKIKLTLSYLNQIYNKAVIQGKDSTIYSNIGIVDFAYKLTPGRTLRCELQTLQTKQDHGSWAYVLLEYSIGSDWFVGLADQYNYGNSIAKDRLHYPYGTVGYIKNATRITLAYGKQREGIFCVGGVCRAVPASNAITLSVTSSF